MCAWVVLTPSDSILRQFNSQFHRLLYAAFPASFQDCLFHYLSYSLQAAGARDEEGGGKHAYPSQHLLGLNVVHRYATTLMRVAFDEIDKIAAEEAAEGLTERRLARARQRVSSSLSNWMSAIFQGELTGADSWSSQQATKHFFARSTRGSTTTYASRSLTFGELFSHY